MKPFKPGERLKLFAPVWARLRASPEIVQLVKFGHRIVFLPGQKPELGGPDWSKATKLPKHQMVVIKEEIKSLVEKKAMRILSRKEARRKPGFYSKMFCVEKSSGGWRPVINLKPLNRFVSKKSFRLETLKSVRAALQPGMWATTIDLSDAYYHIRCGND